MIKKLKYSFPGLIFVFSLLMACNSPSNKEDQEKIISGKELRDDLIEANKEVVKTEDDQIKDLIRRYGWEMENTTTGLRYAIDDTGSGKTILDGDRVTLEYTVKLISGDIVYSSEDEGPMTLIVGREGAVAGLQEGLLLLKKGSVARFIIPSYLGYGLIGDGNKIRQKATLIYFVKVIDVK
jgi:FKBP-type peptidyl-prolyl cis-trans isomerase